MTNQVGRSTERKRGIASSAALADWPTGRLAVSWRRRFGYAGTGSAGKTQALFPNPAFEQI
jgi:hypothetical protein